MGKRGPPRQPMSVLKLSGSRRARERAGCVEIPDSDVSIPARPIWLSDDAGQHWDHFAELLLPLGLIGPVYADALVVLCQTLADFIRLRDEARQSEFVRETENGPRVEPIHNLYDAAFSRLMKSLVQFGLTPSAMSSVKPLGKTEKQQEYKLAE
jgi:phage terminase small subunit